MFIKLYSKVNRDHCVASFINEPVHDKNNNLHRRKQKPQISFAVTAKLISAFVFASRIVQFLFYLNQKFQASSSFLCLYRPVCVGPGRNPKLLVFSRTGSNFKSIIIRGEKKRLFIYFFFLLCI